MILMLHVVIAIATLTGGVLSVICPIRALMVGVPVLLGATIASGVALYVVHPETSLLHLCASGLLLTVATMALHLVAKRRFAYTS